MSSFKSIISSITESISNVMHIGAGYCAEHELYQGLGIDSIVFVEADDELFNAALQKFSSSPRISVLQKAIAGQNGERVLFQTNNKRFSSLIEPKKILEFYPNLEVTRQKSVNTITLDSLCEEIQLPADEINLLVLELEGEETHVLENAAAEVLQKFKWIVVRTGTEVLDVSTSNKSGSEIAKMLHNADFDDLCFKEDAPPYCNYLFTRNDAALANAELEKKSESILADIQSLTTDNLDLMNQNSALDSEIVQFKKQNAELTKTLDTTQTELSETHTLISDSTKEKEELQQQIADLTETLQTAQAELRKTHTLVKKNTKEKEQLQQQIADLTETLQTTQAEFHEARVQNDSLKTEKTMQQERIEELGALRDEAKTELKEASHALRINNKLVAKTDADLRDLQARYQSAIESQKQQHALLSELQDKLIQASMFYRQLNLQDQNIESDIFSDDVESISNEPVENSDD